MTEEKNKTKTAPKKRKKSSTRKPSSTAAPTTCPKCGSTEREKYHGTRRVAGSCTIGNELWGWVDFKNTKCKKCGQARVDRIPGR
jgi:hypothetical protein